MATKICPRCKKDFKALDKSTARICTTCSILAVSKYWADVFRRKLGLSPDEYRDIYQCACLAALECQHKKSANRSLLGRAAHDGAAQYLRTRHRQQVDVGGVTVHRFVHLDESAFEADADRASTRHWGHSPTITATPEDELVADDTYEYIQDLVDNRPKPLASSRIRQAIRMTLDRD